MALSLFIQEDNMLWDPVKEEFISCKQQTIKLEHSLVSISKWEAKWHKSFLDNNGPSNDEEWIDYIQAMTLTQNVDPSTFEVIVKTPYLIKQIIDYINDPMTATVTYDIGSKKPMGHRDKITSELIYYLMIQFSIPVEFQKWHLNRLLTLIRVCEIKNSTGNKLKGKELGRYNSSLNAARRRALGSKG